MSRVLTTAAVALGALALLSAQGCSDQEPFAKAYKVTSPDQLIGGDVAMTRVGDYILENDRIRVGILDVDASPAPGVFGGTLVDADIQRPESRFRSGKGQDQLAEMFPFANLLFPRPGTGQIAVIADGSDGGAAIVRVTGEGGTFLEALSILGGDLLGLFFPDVFVDLQIQTDYILEPGAAYVRMVSTASRTDITDLTDGVLPIPVVSETTPVFQAFLGDSDKDLASGLVAGDFVFFGGRNDLFAPGIGYDEEKPIFDALFNGQDTFTAPLAFDYMAASGGPVSYGYFSVKAAQNDPDPRILAPIITSSSTAFVTSALNCSTNASDNATCDDFDRWSWERYFVVGQGDIASIADVVHAVRGVPVGQIEGVVWGGSGAPYANGRVFVFRDPDGGRAWEDVYALAAANIDQVGVPGVLNVIEADVGLDRVENGRFQATMPPGTYVAVATNEAQTATSLPLRFTVNADSKTTLAPYVPAPGRIRYTITDGQGTRIAGKLNLVSVLADDSLAELDGLRRPFMGQGRLGNGLRYQYDSMDGHGVVEVEAGSYELIVSHGPEFSVHRQRFTIAPGQQVTVAAALVREIDTRGWIAGDFHLHSEGSFDSGMPFEDRVVSALTEGVELAVSTDHDIVTDYRPAVAELGLTQRIKTAIGVEMSTLELGHFIAFPLKYDASIIPHHGAPDWTCLDGPQLLAEIGSRIVDGEPGVRIVAHPRDGFIGLISQMGIDQWTSTRDIGSQDVGEIAGGKSLGLEANNVLLARSTCDFEAIEVFNSKRFDLVRTPTIEEVILFNRCNARIDAANDTSALDASCPELSLGGPLTTCPAGSDDRPAAFFACQMRFRRALAFTSARDILIRTPEEQLANWTFIPDADSADECEPTTYPDAIPSDAATTPCVEHQGAYDDWMHWLSMGLAKTITAASDSHGREREPGTPRTYVKSPASNPGDIDPGAVAMRMTEGAALPTFGPFVTVSVAGAGPGDVTTVAGGTFQLDLTVQTASWFGVDRIEVYVSGMLEHVITLPLDHGPEVVVDVDERITLPAPDKDGFVSVVALGTREENLMRPVARDVNFGELQLPRIASLAFGAIPAFANFFAPTPSVPDFFPVFPMAITNAIFLDVDGDGLWRPAGELPAFCERTCDPASSDPAQCPDGHTCLSSGDCGIAIDRECVTGPPGTEARSPFFTP